MRTFYSVRNNSISSLVMMIWMLIVITTITIVNGQCMPPDTKDCGPFGECITTKSACYDVDGGNSCEREEEEQDLYCKCKPGYAGDDCSFEVELCADAVGSLSIASCYNGGHCYMTEEIVGDANIQVWKCDCRESFGEAHVYAGHQCEYPAEVSCERGVETSRYAFCVNGGRCVSQIRSGDKFDGCKCPANYEGRHCQYKIGSAPTQELEYLPPPPINQYKRMSGGVLFFLILCSMLFVGGISFFGWYHTSKNTTTTSSNNNNKDHNKEEEEQEVGEGMEMRNTQQQQVVAGESGVMT